jgi:acetyl-CoA synthetase
MEVVGPQLRAMQRRALEDTDAFWAEQARELHWFRQFDSVLDWTPPTFKWFSGGRTNLSYSCLDRHVERGWGGHAAFIAIDESGSRRVLTYAHLLNEVKHCAAALRGMGIGRGDRITISMPTTTEAVVLMLACVRVGAIHSVVFAGFGAGALGERVRMSGSRLVFTSDVTWRKGKGVPLKPIVDEALAAGSHDVEWVVVLRRTSDPCPMTSGRDITWDDFLSRGLAQPTFAEPMESNEPAFILATSGTTAAPKLAVHTHGGYQVGIHTLARWVYDLRATDVWWSTSDIGWIVGHSYIVYAPLLAGCTTIAFEGAVDHPGPETFWRVIEDNRVTAMFTSPTAVRLLMRYGEKASEGIDLGSLERVFCAGEVLNAPAWEWLQKIVLRDRIPVIDHMWQTETGGPVFANPYGLGLLPIKAGSAGVPMPGWEAEVMTPEGAPVPAGEKGIVVLKRPFPSLTPAIWEDPERYARDYWEKIPGVYFTGDAAQVDEDGYFWFSGRADEIIKIAAHRLGTIEVETAFLRNPAVAEAGVTGRPDDLRGEVISAFVVLRQGNEPSEDLRARLIDTVRRELGPLAVIGEVRFVGILPKTRSGKIMRRVLKAVVLDRDVGDISTIEDEGSVEEAREAWQALKQEVG